MQNHCRGDDGKDGNAPDCFIIVDFLHPVNLAANQNLSEFSKFILESNQTADIRLAGAA